jgi:hypothetical protein
VFYDIEGLIECAPDEERQALPGDANPFTYLQSPLKSAIDELGEEYRQHVAERTQDTFTRKLTSLLERDDIMEANGTLWTKLHCWRQSYRRSRPRAVAASATPFVSCAKRQQLATRPSSSSDSRPSGPASKPRALPALPQAHQPRTRGA